MNLKLIAIPLALLTLGLTACDVSEPDVDDEDLDLDDSSEVEAELDPETTFYTRTTVIELPDGTIDVVHEKVSLAQQIAEREAEASGMTYEEFVNSAKVEFPDSYTSALSVASPCTWQHLRLYAAKDFAGDVLCLTGGGDAYLQTWSRFNGCVWGYAAFPTCGTPVKSYKTGTIQSTLSQTSAFWCTSSSILYANTESADSTTAFSLHDWVRRSATASCTP